MSFIQLKNGIFDFNRDDNVISIDNVAFSLSGQNRYLGHSEHFYSVAQHCVILANYVRDVLRLGPEEQYKALMHDWVESLIGDMPYPLKRLIPEFEKFENKIWNDYHKQLNLPEDMNSDSMLLVKSLDRRIVYDEFYSLFGESSLDRETKRAISGLVPLGINIKADTRVTAYRKFLSTHEEICYKLINMGLWNT